MKEYFIKSTTEVFEDNYIDGEGRGVNCYEIKGEVKANNEKEAVTEFLAKHLFFTNGDLDDEDGVYYNTVDNENNEITHADTEIFEKFKNGEIILYNSYTRFRVFELIEISIN